MGRLIIINSLRFLILIPLQVLVLDNINLGGHVNPYLYIMFILLLPFETPGWLLLVSSFALGISIDVFSGTHGLHASASLVTAYLRPFVAKNISSRRDFESGMLPSVRDLGLQWFLTYAALLIVIHHLFLFLIEAFKWTELLDILQRTIYSAVFTLTLVLISEYLFSLTPRRR